MPAVCCSSILTLEDWWSVWIGFTFLLFVCIFATIMHPIDAHHPVPLELYKYDDNPLDAWNSPTQCMIIALWGIMFVSASSAVFFMDKGTSEKRFKHFIVGFHVIFIMTLLSKWAGANNKVSRYGIGAAVISVLFGAIVSNVLFYQVLPKTLACACTDELFIKINVVLLAVNVRSIINLGVRGLVVAWVDTPIVLVVTTLIGFYVLRVPIKQAVIMAAALSVCGTSAAAAFASVLGVKKDEYKTTLVIMSLFTVPVIPLMPLIGKSVGLNANAIGAWIGGTVDTTGAVIASASISREVDTVETAAIVKMLQNSIMGPLCLLLGMISQTEWWRKSLIDERGLSLDDDDVDKKDDHQQSWSSLLWQKFPKFLIGFLVTSIFLSYVIPNHMVDSAIAWSFSCGEWFGTYGFVAIGFNIRFKEMKDQVSILFTNKIS